MAERHGVEYRRNWYVLISGLPLANSPLSIASGLSLLALPARLTIFDLAAAGGVGFKKWSVLEPFVATCLSEIESAADAATTPGYDTLNRAWLLSCLLTLRGYGGHLCLACSAYSWSRIAGSARGVKIQLLGSEPGIEIGLPRFEGDLLDYHVKWLVEKEARSDPVSSADATWIQEQYELVNGLAATSPPFRFALEAAIDWRYTRDARVAIARIWSGIEGIFAVNTELVYRLSLLAASVLVPRGPKRLDRFEQIRQLYGIRSKAVHGEHLTPEALETAMNASYQLLRDLLLEIVRRRRCFTKADLDAAVFH